MRYIITESQLNSLFVRRRIEDINHLVNNALDRVSPSDYSFHDYVEEIAWQVADEYRNFDYFDVDELMNYVRETYWRKIEAEYLSYFGNMR